MPDLATLKGKWFLTMTGDVLGVPQRRHTDGTAISVSTDGNTVERLIDGEAYMRRWHSSVAALALFSATEIYHAGWRFENVEPLGVGTGPRALQGLKDADTAGADVFTLLSEHVGSIATNLVAVDWLRLHGLWQSCRDNRYPPAGSNHHKCAVFKSSGGDKAVLGSIDISSTRWDTQTHAHTNAMRAGGPTHDTGVDISGPALADIDLCFRERWNDSTRTLGMTPLLPPQPLISSRSATGPATGTHSVQVLRTFGITSTRMGYSWSPRGEFTVWASYLNAIRRASNYIYIEDQYFLPWDYPPRFARPVATWISSISSARP